MGMVWLELQLCPGLAAVTGTHGDRSHQSSCGAGWGSFLSPWTEVTFCCSALTPEPHGEMWEKARKAETEAGAN